MSACLFWWKLEVATTGAKLTDLDLRLDKFQDKSDASRCLAFY